MTSTPRNASLARKALPALVLTGTSIGLLTQLDRAGHASTSDGLAVPAPGTTRAPSTVTPSTRTPSTTASGRTGSGLGRSGTNTAPPTTGTVPATPTSCTNNPVSGPAIMTRFGPVQVTAQLNDDGSLCDITTATGPSDDRHSMMINSRALPVLRLRALQAGGAGFQAVTGATITSQGYRASLQAILDA